jgi:polyferredoxin
MYPVIVPRVQATTGFSAPPDSAARSGRKSYLKEKEFMRNAMAYAFIVVAVAPLIGIWRGHVWAKANGLVLRKTNAATVEQTRQTA